MQSRPTPWVTMNSWFKPCRGSLSKNLLPGRPPLQGGTRIRNCTQGVALGLIISGLSGRAATRTPGHYLASDRAHKVYFSFFPSAQRAITSAAQGNALGDRESQLEAL